MRKAGKTRMKNIRVLDCTLRDGGRIINCEFSDRDIRDITWRLADANIDIIEVGFIRDWHSVHYEGNSTFFTDVDQIVPFVQNRKQGLLYFAFVDYGMFDFDSLKPYDGRSIDGIRVGFTKNNYTNSKADVIRCLNIVKERGYKLIIQGVNSLGYTDKEYLELIELVNETSPYAFGIVDTYGAMYLDDVKRLYTLVDHNLDEDICIDFHSHNNFQLSFSFAQEIIAMSHGKRNLIIDATLNGMGKCAGNLNTELIVDYLDRKLNMNYDFDSILDIIDDHLYQIGLEKRWGYSIPAMMAGVYKSHPNNVIFLTEKYRLATKDIKHILSMIAPDIRQRYDYEIIKKLYQDYNHTKVDDKQTLDILSQRLKGKELLLILPGNSIDVYEKKINAFIYDRKPFIISVNFITKFGDRDDRIAFFGSEKRYKCAEGKERESIVVVSNILNHSENDLVVNYESLIERDNDDFDNSMIMLLNLLRRMNIVGFSVAGFDGYQKDSKNYSHGVFRESGRFAQKHEATMTNMQNMLRVYKKRLGADGYVKFLTPSVYENIFMEQDG